MISIKSDQEIKILQEGGKILAQIMNELACLIKPGINTAILEELACNLMKEAGGRPAFKNFKTYSGFFPTALCTSINNEVVHAPAIPGRELKEGDIISIDIGMEYPLGKKINKQSKQGGLYTDMARTFAVGKISEKTQKLLDTTERSLYLAIEKVKPGAFLNEIGTTIQNFVETNGFSVVRDLVGHGVGYDVHEDPQIPHYNIKESGLPNVKLKKGMVIAIEPMVNMGSYGVLVAPDNNTFITEDGSLSAHFENTIAVVEDGALIITEIKN